MSKHHTDLIMCRKQTGIGAFSSSIEQSMCQADSAPLGVASHWKDVREVRWKVVSSPPFAPLLLFPTNSESCVALYVTPTSVRQSWCVSATNATLGRTVGGASSVEELGYQTRITVL